MWADGVGMECGLMGGGNGVWADGVTVAGDRVKGTGMVGMCEAWVCGNCFKVCGPSIGKKYPILKAVSNTTHPGFTRTTCMCPEALQQLV